MRNIPHSSMFHRSVHETLKYYESYTLHCKSCTMKYTLHSMKVISGMECTYLEEHLWWMVECLSGIEGTLDEASLMVGWGASVKMIGSVVSLTLLALSVVAEVVTLVIGVTGNIEFPFNWLKESKERELFFPLKFPGCASACSSK